MNFFGNVWSELISAHSREFGRQFQEVVREACSATELAVPLVKDQVIKLFIKGLQDADVCMQVHLTKPATLADAVSSANTTELGSILFGSYACYECK